MSMYHYTECGLRHVYIHGLAPFIDDEEGEAIIHIPCANRLHKAIAAGLVRHARGMQSDEIRFLRTEMGLTQAELANILHRDGRTVGRWERGESRIDGAAETLLRALAKERLALDIELGLEEFSRYSALGAEIRPLNIRLEDARTYRLEAA